MAGHYLTRALRACLARRRQVEQQETKRRRALAPEAALKKITTNVCPACERALMTSGDVVPDYCVHCGFGTVRLLQQLRHQAECVLSVCPKCGAAAHDSTIG